MNCTENPSCAALCFDLKQLQIAVNDVKQTESRLLNIPSGCPAERRTALLENSQSAPCRFGSHSGGARHSPSRDQQCPDWGGGGQVNMYNN
jgi:hypothetical protein